MIIMKFAAASTILLSMALTGCERPGHSTSAPTSEMPIASAPTTATATPDPAQAWLGRWNGPEGTYLQLNAADNGSYEVRIKDLDAERTFKGVAKDGAIHFERDGKQESIKPTNGDATDMKWLAGKTKCLTVHPGEGYCRD